MREIYTARLEAKTLLSAAAECYHLSFAFVGAGPAKLEPGQFLSMLAEDPEGKSYTRAYSLASGPTIEGGTQGFDLCVNRVQGGFFSNLLCDISEGTTMQCHGPHGLFTLRPGPAASVMVAAGTGIAPMRGFAQWLFAEEGLERSGGQPVWLVYEASHPDELFYDSYFRELSRSFANFHYVPVIGSEGRHQEMERALADLAATCFSGHPAKDAVDAATQAFTAYAYVCGLGEMVKAARSMLASLGWQKGQMLFERYD